MAGVIGGVFFEYLLLKKIGNATYKWTARALVGSAICGTVLYISSRISDLNRQLQELKQQRNQLSTRSVRVIKMLERQQTKIPGQVIEDRSGSRAVSAFLKYLQMALPANDTIVLKTKFFGRVDDYLAAQTDPTNTLLIGSDLGNGSQAFANLQQQTVASGGSWVMLTEESTGPQES
jgi:hypothetical protein